MMLGLCKFNKAVWAARFAGPIWKASRCKSDTVPPAVIRVSEKSERQMSGRCLRG